MQANPTQPQLIFHNECDFSYRTTIKCFSTSAHLAIGDGKRFTVWDLSSAQTKPSPIAELNNVAITCLCPVPDKQEMLLATKTVHFFTDDNVTVQVCSLNQQRPPIFRTIAKATHTQITRLSYEKTADHVHLSCLDERYSYSYHRTVKKDAISTTTLTYIPTNTEVVTYALKEAPMSVANVLLQLSVRKNLTEMKALYDWFSLESIPYLHSTEMQTQQHRVVVAAQKETHHVTLYQPNGHTSEDPKVYSQIEFNDSGRATNIQYLANNIFISFTQHALYLNLDSNGFKSFKNPWLVPAKYGAILAEKGSAKNPNRLLVCFSDDKLQLFSQEDDDKPLMLLNQFNYFDLFAHTYHPLKINPIDVHTELQLVALKITDTILGVLDFKPIIGNSISSEASSSLSVAAAAAAPPDAAIVPTTDFPQVKNRVKIHDGQTAKVYQGVYQDKEIAFKVYRLAVNDKILSKAQAEQNIWQNLDHPHIIKLIDVFQSDKKFGLVLEWQPQNLSELYQQRKLTDYERKTLTKDIASGIHYSHTQTPSILHRDIRGTN
ncbi:MAG: protein kinase family protein, partial [Chlamydiia bacterium]|nr:protein kinase family protein [Chlamydiia bacterium]